MQSSRRFGHSVEMKHADTKRGFGELIAGRNEIQGNYPQGPRGRPAPRGQGFSSTRDLFYRSATAFRLLM